MELSSIPIPLLLVSVVILVVFSVEAGFRIGRAVSKGKSAEKEAPVSSISGYILGLLAFIMAFTFSIVTDRYETRKELVREEANIARTVWMRADFLPDSMRVASKELLREYVAIRITAAKSFDKQKIDEALQASSEIYRKLWTMAVTGSREHLDSDVAALYLESLTDLANVNASRVVVALHTRIPSTIWYVLLVLILLGMFSVGYQTAIAGSPRSWVTLVMAISFSIVIVMIETLDRGHTAWIPVSQYPLEYLLQTIDKGLHI